MTEELSAQYQKQLTQIAKNIRCTRDINIIWQQTVQGLGKALEVSRCIICPYKNSSSEVQVIAEYCQQPFASMLGGVMTVAEEPELTQALTTKEPIVLDTPEGVKDKFERYTLLAIATCYEDQPNSLIVLHQCDRLRQWNAAEIEFVRELADQVGAALAHATIYQELQEAREQAQAASHLKKEFLGTISHELRTPLNGMIGFLSLILDDMVDEPDEQRAFIEEAHRSSLRLLNIINDILAMGEPDTKDLELELGSVNLKELLSDTEHLTRQSVQQKHLELIVEKPPTRDEILLYGNYRALLQIMLNIVGNAIKFTPDGEITISTKIVKKKIRVRNQQLPGMVEIAIADTGIGVPIDKLDKLFGLFTKVDGSLTSRYAGTGLGLAISKKLIEAMNGEINFYSMGEGLGSTVTFTIPLYQEPVMISPQQTSSMNILI